MLLVLYGVCAELLFLGCLKFNFVVDVKHWRPLADSLVAGNCSFAHVYQLNGRRSRPDSHIEPVVPLPDVWILPQSPRTQNRSWTQISSG